MQGSELNLTRFMQMKTVPLLGVCLLLCLAGSSLAQTPKPTVEDLERRIRSLELQVRGLQTRTATKYASVDCNTGKFDEFQFSGGTLILFASCTKIEPYLEGHRITLSIGNPHSFSFSNVKGNLSYGKDWVEALERQVEVSLVDPLRAGAWTTINVTVNPSKPEQMRYIGLELNSQTAVSTR
jgi:hypothetical protein